MPRSNYETYNGTLDATFNGTLDAAFNGTLDAAFNGTLDATFNGTPWTFKCNANELESSSFRGSGKHENEENDAQCEAIAQPRLTTNQNVECNADTIVKRPMHL